MSEINFPDWQPLADKWGVKLRQSEILMIPEHKPKTVEQLQGDIKRKEREMLRPGLSDDEIQKLKKEIGFLKQVIARREQETNK